MKPIMIRDLVNKTLSLSLDLTCSGELWALISGKMHAY